ncbi:hypothetical protein CIW51_31655 [Mycolicibacterium sp. P9-22]|nr:hypothetical protein CIW51_31655 [Mycolicibacterium sp. P9-22]
MTDKNLTTVQRVLTVSICAFLAVGFVATWQSARTSQAETVDFLIFHCFNDKQRINSGQELANLEACEQEVNPEGGSPRVTQRKQELREFDACADEAVRTKPISDDMLDECYEQRNQG